MTPPAVWKVMRLLALFAAALLCVSSTAAFPQHSTTRAKPVTEKPPATEKSPAWPAQMEMRVPFEPTVFPNGHRSYLLYELCLTNFGSNPHTLSGIDVMDGDTPIGGFNAEQLKTMVQPVGRNGNDAKDRLAIGGGQSVIVFMEVSFDRTARVPEKLTHRFVAADTSLTGAEIDTHHTRLHLFGPPLEGGEWLASDAPSNEEDNHHRRGVVVVDGRMADSRRYAIDWKKVRDGASFSGDARDVHSYFSYGEPIFAVAEGRVITTKDNLPENVPGHGDAFHPAVPITLDTVGGNRITLDLGGGQYAYYMHLQPGSLRVKPGDRVRRGQMLARVGASGDAREPHLHFEVTTSPRLIFGDGVPYVIERYRSKSGNDAVEIVHLRDLPWNNELVTFEKK